MTHVKKVTVLVALALVAHVTDVLAKNKQLLTYQSLPLVGGLWCFGTEFERIMFSGNDDEC